MAVVELAVCMPILVLVVFATIEACSMLYLKQTLKITAYEGARVGITPESTSANVELQCQSLLDARNVQGYSIATEPVDPSMLSEGDFFEVTITTPYAENSLLGGWFYADKTLVQSCALRTN